MKRLEEYMNTLIHDGICVAFSGGVDSSVILKIACQAGKRVGVPVYAVTFETKLHPKADLPIAKVVAKEAGAVHHVIYVDELNNEKILRNPVDRCYHCKHYLFSTLKEYCEEIGVHHILDGTNYDDLSQYRPGIQALRDIGVLSPFAELEITKQEVRDYANALDISVSDRPSSPCLATRLPYDTEIDYQVLEKIDKGETFLARKGFLVNRIRVHGDIARIEIRKDQFEEMIEVQEEAIEELKNIGFPYVTLDLEGFRSGSMDIHLHK